MRWRRSCNMSWVACVTRQRSWHSSSKTIGPAPPMAARSLSLHLHRICSWRELLVVEARSCNGSRVTPCPTRFVRPKFSNELSSALFGKEIAATGIVGIASTRRPVVERVWLCNTGETSGDISLRYNRTSVHHVNRVLVELKGRSAVNVPPGMTSEGFNKTLSTSYLLLMTACSRAWSCRLGRGRVDLIVRRGLKRLQFVMPLGQHRFVFNMS